ncbi:MAG: superinfection immunity protein [Psychrobium sp.]|nr:superinfection immunity protein [Psychrobium sp.]
MEFFDEIVDSFTNFSSVQLMVTIPILLVIYFLPSIIAIFKNPKQLKLIVIANVPGGLSWIAWIALMGWAISGKAVPTFKKK